jgi:hypothetical protein
VRRAVLVAFGLAACRDVCGRTTEAALDAGAPAHAADDPPVVAHDCSGLAPDVAKCAETAAPWDELTLLSERLTELPARHTPPEDGWWAPMDAALARAEAAADLRGDERIVVQNAALFLALSAGQRGQRRLAERAFGLVRRLAFAPDERPESLEADPALGAWIGPREAWIERTREPPLMHESLHAFTRVFRLVRTPALHANFSQLVAIDTRGAPFVTRVVGSLEIRRGETDDAAACVALPRPSFVRCGVGAGLSPARLSELPSSHFLQRDDTGHLRCNNCHGPAGTMTDSVLGTRDLSALEAPADLAARRAVVLDRLRQGMTQ